MTREEAIKWIDDRMCFGRGTFTEHHPPNIDECWQAGMMAIEALTYKNLKKPNNTCEVDLISRADAIEAVDELPTKDTPIELYEVYRMAINDAEWAIDALPSADAVKGWIPCYERLPEKDELVLVTVWNDVTIAWRNIYGGWDSAEDMYEKGDVTAWMPLPKPYREDSEA